MSGLSEERCQYTWPENIQKDANPNSQSCCIRETLPDTDRCILHTHVSETNYKKNQNLQNFITTSEEYIESIDNKLIIDGACLLGIDIGDNFLSNASLRDADMRNTDLVGEDLSGANLAGADFTDADLMRADLREAELANATLSHAALFHAKLNHANLNHATITDALLEGADLTDSTLREADLSDSIIDVADLSGSHLYEANLSGVELNGTTLTGVNLMKAKLDGAEAEDADFSESKLIETDLSESIISKSKFTGANLKDANLSFSEAEKADFSDANLRETKLISADCEGAVFERALLIRALLEDVNLTKANLTDAFLFGAKIDGAQIDSRTRLCEDGTIGEIGTDNYCRYDADSKHVDAIESVHETANELARKEELADTIRFRRARSVYRRLEDLARQNGFPDVKSEMFVRRQEARRKLLYLTGSRRKKIFAEIQKQIFLYGESFTRIGLVFIFSILFFWVIYTTSGVVKTSEGNTVYIGLIADNPTLIFDTLAQSIRGFFAGTQQLQPIGSVGGWIIAIQSTIGPILTALVIFVLGRRAAR